MSRRLAFYLEKLEWLGPILVRGFGLLGSAEALEQSFSFSQAMVLQTLHRTKSMKMTELARFLGLSKTNATGLIDRLVRRGLVERTRSEEDRRVVIVSLTRDGCRTAAGLAVAMRKSLTALMKRVPEENLGQFIDTLEQLARSMSEMPETSGPARRR